MTPPERIAIIGGGWAGLSCALGLRRLGPAIDLFEAAPLWGGRARSAGIELAGRKVTVDCGQHLLLGACHDSLALMAESGSEAARRLRRRRLRLVDPCGLELRRRALPGAAGLALGLLLARGLSPLEKWAATRLLRRLQAAAWQPPAAGLTVTALLAAFAQPPELVRKLWEPLCLGALNTPPTAACAASFAAILRDTLGGAADDSDFLLLDAPLAALLGDPACERLREAGAGLHASRSVSVIARGPAGWTLELRGPAAGVQPRAYAHVVIATSVPAAIPLVRALCPEEAARLAAFEFAPIATAYLAWRGDPDLPEVAMLRESPARGDPGQWFFDRGRQAGLRVGAVVISARERYPDLDSVALGTAAAAQVAHQLAVPPPDDVRVLTERRATWRCTPDRPRFAIDALARVAPGVWLAGDYLDPEYPATLESAVRSGQRVARRIDAALQSQA